MKFKELTTKSEAEVKKTLEELQEQAQELAVKIRLSQEKQTHKLRALKKDIARIKTFLHTK